MQQAVAHNKGRCSASRPSCTEATQRLLCAPHASLQILGKAKSGLQSPADAKGLGKKPVLPDNSAAATRLKHKGQSAMHTACETLSPRNPTRHAECTAQHSREAHEGRSGTHPVFDQTRCMDAQPRQHTPTYTMARHTALTWSALGRPGTGRVGIRHSPSTPP